MDVGLGFAGVGLAFLGFAGVLYLLAYRYARAAIAASGTVVAQAKSESAPGRVSYHPVVEFTTADGRTLRITERLGRNPPFHAVGDTVTVSYRPGRPERARIAGGVFFLPYLFAFIGGAFLAGGLVVLLVAAFV